MTARTAELAPKIIEFLQQIVPSCRRVALFLNATDPFREPFLEHSQHGADRLGIELHATFVNGPAELTSAFEQAASEKMDAVIIQPSLPIERAAELALVNHLPAASPTSAFAQAGGLMSYSADYAELWHETAVYVAKILRGAKPADLPVEQTMKFDLVVNLETAKARGLTVPPSMLALADQVIELR